MAAAFVGVALPASTFAYDDHVVQPGETLSIIAERYGFPVETLVDVNGLSSADDIRVGQVIRIPGGTPTSTPAANSPAAGPGRSHTVQPGEWLSTIAINYGVTVEQIVAMNGIANPDAIRPGDVLTIPGGQPAAPTAGAASTGATKKHVVQAGEWLSVIAKKYDTSVHVLVVLNDLASPDAIVEGQVLLVPDERGPEAPAPASLPGRRHTVARGETLSHIADTYGVAVSALLEVNGLANPDSIFAGEVLTIPAVQGTGSASASSGGRSHRVEAGETLADIAARFHVTVQSIVDANGLANPNRIVIGQQLSIPSSIGVTFVSRAEYAAALENAAAEFGISHALVKAVAWQESGWNQTAVSHANAIGLMQVTPPTAQWARENLISGVADWETNPVSNARMGAAILHHWLVQSGWDTRTALAAYYQGWTSVHTIGWYEDTKEYVANVLALIPEFE